MGPHDGAGQCENYAGGHPSDLSMRAIYMDVVLLSQSPTQK